MFNSISGIRATYGRFLIELTIEVQANNPPSYSFAQTSLDDL